MSHDLSAESEPRQLDNSAYTVGWITALPHEAAASEAILDKLNQPPTEKNPKDTNEYTLGSISGPGGEHHVVMASLPSGIHGTISAATVAAQMLSSFPAIKFGLMVGIGGGIWTKKNDVRLGDVVVSQPGGEFGGVRLYGFGKETPQGFEARGQLNAPPTELLKAVNKLQASHYKKRSRVPEILKRMLDAFPDMADPDEGPGFVYQGADQDRLFKSDYKHQDDNENCNSCDKAEQVERTARKNANPRIHYGTIASGNVLIADPKIRDSMPKECLCIEMEAAGLMKDFPCLVIRGISDYCDSHKNDQWQNYAAATAAAYAKELLSVTSPAVFDKTPLAVEAMKEIGQLKQLAQKTWQSTTNHQKGEEKKRILNWMTNIDYGPRYSQILSARCEKTGHWLLISEKFQTWIASKGDVLICPGIPGAGKTFLSATVIGHIYDRYQDERTVGIAYLFCEYAREHEQSVDQLLSSLLKQLCQTQDNLPEAITKLYNTHHSRATRPQLKKITQSLQYLIDERFSKVLIIIDALDECKQDRRKRFITELITLHKASNVNFFITSREVFTPLQGFNGYERLDILAADEDINIYFEKQRENFNDGVLDENGSLDDLLHEIPRTICKMAKGMFLLAQFHISSLVQAQTRAQLQNRLRMIANGEAGLSLEEAYEKTIAQIDAQNPSAKQLAKQTLAWLVLTGRQFKADELCMLLAIEAGTRNLNAENTPAFSTIVQACATLVVVDERWNTVRLAHFTTQEFLAHPEQNFLKDMHAYLAKACLTYLQYDYFQSGKFQSAPYEKEEPKLYHYLASRWNHHLGHASKGQLPGDAMLNGLREKFLKAEPPSPAFQYWQSRLTLGLVSGIMQGRRGHRTTCVNIIYSPSTWGCHDDALFSRRDLRLKLEGAVLVLKALIFKSLEWSRVKLAPCAHPEHWRELDKAEENVSIEDCQLDDGSLVSVSDLQHVKNALTDLAELFHPLAYMSEGSCGLSTWQKREHSIRKLDGNRAFIWDEGKERLLFLAQELERLFPFFAAHQCRRQHPWEDWDTRLLRSGFRSEFGATSHQCCDEIAHITLLLLLELKPKLGWMRSDRSDDQPRFLRWWLALLGKYQCQRGFDWEISKRNDIFGSNTEYFIANYEVFDDMINWLLELPEVYDCREYRYLQPLEFDLDNLLRMAHRELGYKAILFLVCNGANVNLELPERLQPSSSPLICIILDHESTVECVQHLLERGANVNQIACHGAHGTSLIAACAKGRDDIVSLLLQQVGIDVSQLALVGNYGTSLIAACAEGRDDIVSLLLQQVGIDVSQLALAGTYGTALIAACAEGRDDIVSLLLQQVGIDVNQLALAGTYGTALIAACTEGRNDIVLLLLEQNGINVNQVSTIGSFRTALVAACSKPCHSLNAEKIEKKAACVQLLLAKGAEINQQSPNGRYATALEAACDCGLTHLVQLLLQHDVDVDIQVFEGPAFAALTVACGHGYHDIVKLLLLANSETSPEAGETNFTAAITAAARASSPRTVSLLLNASQKADVFAASTTPCALAASIDHWGCFGSQVYNNPVVGNTEEEKAQCKLAARQVAVAVIYSLLSAEMDWGGIYIPKALECTRICSSLGTSDYRAAGELLGALGFDNVNNRGGCLRSLRSTLRACSVEVASQEDGWKSVVADIAGQLRQFEQDKLPLITNQADTDMDDFDCTYSSDDLSFGMDEDEACSAEGELAMSGVM